MDSLRYRNPIRGGDLDTIGDPQLMMEDGRFWLTGSRSDRGVDLLSSTDMRTWRFEKLLLDREHMAEDAWCHDRFWAPEIHRCGGRYYLAFNANNEALRFPHSCGLAVSGSLAGPYELATAQRPLIERGNDLTLFSDHDGASYAYWNTGAAIFGCRIDLADGELAGRPFECIRNTYYTWDEIGIEGPYVVLRGDWYFLFFSSWTRGYEIGYAVDRHPSGPWKKWDGNPVYGAMNEEECRRRGIRFTQDPRIPFVAIGHNTIFTDTAGRDWLVAHYQRRGEERSLGIEPLQFVDDMVRIGPSAAGEREVPWCYPQGGVDERP